MGRRARGVPARGLWASLGGLNHQGIVDGELVLHRIGDDAVCFNISVFTDFRDEPQAALCQRRVRDGLAGG